MSSSDSICKYCQGHCVEIEYGSPVCMDDMTYFFCGDTLGIIWVLIIVFWALNIIVLIISRFLEYKTPVTTIIYSFLQLGFTSFFIGSLSCLPYLDNFLVFLFIGIFGLIFLFIFERSNLMCGGLECDCYKSEREKYRTRIRHAKLHPKDNCCKYQCCCCKWGVCCSYDCCLEPYDPLGVLREMKYENCTFDELKNIIYEDATLPPLPYQKGIAYHYDDSSDGPNLVITFTHLENIPYSSWQENGHLEGDFSEYGNMVYTNQKGYKFIDMDGNIEEVKAICENEIRNRDQHTSQSTEVDYPGMSTGKIHLDLDDKVMKFYTSCFCKHFLYNIAMLFGFAPIVDLFWRMRIRFVTFISEKMISSNPDLRAQPNQRDTKYFQDNAV